MKRIYSNGGIESSVECRRLFPEKSAAMVMNGHKNVKREERKRGKIVGKRSKKSYRTVAPSALKVGTLWRGLVLSLLFTFIVRFHSISMIYYIYYLSYQLELILH